MVIPWGVRRQLLYYAVATVLVVVIGYVSWTAFLSRAPTCQDGVKNGNEAGIDCGGGCALVCADQSQLPTLLWVRSFPQGGGYSAVAYLQNPNVGAGAKRVSYTFRLFDEKNTLLVERDGYADIPPIQTVPILETNIDVGGRTVARTLFEFTSEPVWSRVSADKLPPIRITDQSLAADGTRLTGTLVNETLDEVRNVRLVAVVFDASGVARGASQTLITRLARQSSEPIIFTWPNGFEDVARAEITILPTF